MQVLIVEDNDTVALGLSRALTTLDDGISVHKVADLKSAESLLRSDRTIDVALVDLGLPDARGIEAPTKLRAIREDLVIVVITGNSSSETALRLIRLGIQDYLLKSETTPHRILRSIQLARERHQRELNLKKIACVDQLTGTLNRRGLLGAVEEAFESATRLNVYAALMTLDIDRFKRINDAWGHPVGDFVLQEASRRIGRCVRRHDVIGRAGGDEFWVILKGFSGPEHVPGFALKMLGSFATPFRADIDLSVGISIGIALVPNHADSIDAWIRKSDDALYGAKRNGRNCWMMYDDLNAESEEEPAKGGAIRSGPSIKFQSAY